MFAEWTEPSVLDKIIVAIHKAICIGAPPAVSTPLSQFLLASSMGEKPSYMLIHTTKAQALTY